MRTTASLQNAAPKSQPLTTSAHHRLLLPRKRASELQTSSVNSTSNERQGYELSRNEYVGTSNDAMEQSDQIANSLFAMGTMAPATRPFRKPGFAHDFGRVRIHSGSERTDLTSANGDRICSLRRPIPGGLSNRAPSSDHHRLGKEGQSYFRSNLRWGLGFPFGQIFEATTGIAVRATAIVDPARCEKRGVEAFTEKSTVFFRSPTPTLRVAAHEAAHVMQHQGITRDFGLGPEAHADAIARRVAIGADARSLIGGSGQTVDATVHAYTDISKKKQGPGAWDAGVDFLRVSDDRNIAVEPQHKKLWATDALIEASYKLLAARGSAFRLKKTPDKLEGPSPDGKYKRSLTRVELENTRTDTKGDDTTVFEQCDLAALDVMGAGPEQLQQVPVGDKSLQNMTAVYNDPHQGDSDVRDRKTKAFSDQEMGVEIIEKNLQGGLVAYRKMDPAQKAKFDKQVGINQAVNPTVGDAFLIARMTPTKKGEFRHHSAGVIMKSGGDYATLEAAADANPLNVIADPSKRWWFTMYGTAVDTTFHDQQKSHYGEDAITMHVSAFKSSDQIPREQALKKLEEEQARKQLEKEKQEIEVGLRKLREQEEKRKAADPKKEDAPKQKKEETPKPQLALPPLVPTSTATSQPPSFMGTSPLPSGLPVKGEDANDPRNVLKAAKEMAQKIEEKGKDLTTRAYSYNSLTPEGKETFLKEEKAWRYDEAFWRLFVKWNINKFKHGNDKNDTALGWLNEHLTLVGPKMDEMLRLVGGK